ncbi:MAG: MBL fold metallo-hydrolase [Bacilli bacterium]
MKIRILASGSSGNSCLVQTKEISLLIDVGIIYNQLCYLLKEIDPLSITAVLITHTHNDHIKGLSSFIKKSGATVFAPSLIIDELKSIIPLESLYAIDDTFSLKDIQVTVIHTSHDAKGSCGYLLKNEDREFVYITDTGYLNRKYLKSLINKDVYLLESNHDEVMLMEGNYPYFLKQRVLSDKGHLSNGTCSSYLTKMCGTKTHHIILAHLSSKNNTTILARKTIEQAFEEEHKVLPQVIIATQNESTEVIEV